MVPTEERWFKCSPIHAVCAIENKILQKKANMTNAQREAGQKADASNERHYHRQRDGGEGHDQIAKVDITRAVI